MTAREDVTPVARRIAATWEANETEILDKNWTQKRNLLIGVSQLRLAGPVGAANCYAHSGITFAPILSLSR
jgi:hypothetical protein